MALTTLDPNTALIVIDLQKGLAAHPTVSPIGEVAARAGALAEVFRRHGLPVVLVNVAGGAPGRVEQVRLQGTLPPDFTELLPELNRQAADHLVTKHTWGAFIRTDLEPRLKALNVTQVVIAGVSTSIGVESTARQAYELGFNVTLAIDAITDTSQAAHANSVANIFPKLGETALTREIVDWLDASKRA